jgi:hypothetical protein
MAMNYAAPQRHRPSITETHSIIEPDPDFQRYLERSESYFEAIRASGGTPWFEDKDKLAELRQRGLPVDASEMEAREWLYARRYPADNWELGVRVRAAA